MDIITYLLGTVLDVIEYIILWVGGRDLSLNNTFKLLLAIFLLILRENENMLFLFLAAYLFRKNSGHCSLSSHI